ncbi:peptidase inhibitor family I36 protein [Cellulomonas sp. KRMCY2]|uniref:peptidase inhibitor family I36 protein n=1 Tax=Cellulomonas sp. KRMCY2 TaxID=1304865 RepID=UPI0009DF0710
MQCGRRHVMGMRCSFRPSWRGAPVLALTVSLVAGPLIPGASAVDVAPASSAQCSAGRACLWSGTLYTGTIFSTTVSGNVSGMTVAGSIWNRTSTAVRVYSAAGGSGSSTCIAPGGQLASTSVAARSVKVMTVTTC